MALMLAATSAQAARWEADIKNDDFGTNHVGTAIVTNGTRAFGLRCENGKVPALIFATREQWAAGLGALPAELLVRVDNHEPIRKKAALESYRGMVGFSTQDLVRAIALGDHIFPLLAEIAGANHRIAVAIEIAGQRFENTRFSPGGSRKAFMTIWPYCGSKLGTYDKPKL